MIEVRPVGWVSSPLRERSEAPRQGDEGAPDVTIHIAEHARDGLLGVTAGASLVVLTWLDRAARDVLVVHPRGDPARRPAGVFATRSPDRPNPIGLHPVTVLAVDGPTLRVSGLEALDGTPVLDLKPALACRPSVR